MLHSTLLVLPLLFTLTHAFPHTLSSQLPTTPETTAVHQAFYESDSLGESEDVGEDAPAREWGGLGAGVKGLFSFGRRSVPVEALWERAVETIIENPKWEAILSESSASVASVVAESVASVASAESVVVVEAQVTTSVTSQATSSAGSSTEPSTSAFEVPSTTAPSPTTSSTTKSSTTKSSTTKLATTTSKKTSTSTTSSSSAAAAAFSAVGETSSGLVLAGVHTGQATYFDVGLGACGNTATNSDYIAAVSYLLYETYPGSNPDNSNDNPICGKQLIVSYGGVNVIVTVQDECMGCEIAWSLDFSPAVFELLAPLSVGRLYGMTWEFLD